MRPFDIVQLRWRQTGHDNPTIAHFITAYQTCLHELGANAL